MKQYNVTGMSCAACSARVEKAVSGVDGVENCAVNLLTNSMGVEGTASDEAIIAAVEKAGYGASLKTGDKKSKAMPDDELKDTQTPKIRNRLIWSVIFLAPLMYISMGHMMWGWKLPAFMQDNHIAMGLAQLLLTVIIMVINQKFFINGFKGIIHRSPNMDTLVALGSTASFVYSVYALFAMTGAQVSTEDMEDVDLYLQTLGVPARRNVDDPTVLQGEQLFYQAKCHLCHVTSLKTRPRGSVLLNNTELPQLGNQVIHPYSDFLLHDMGVELGDDYPSGLANGNEWRTTPLWGLGLQEVVNGHTYYLHDGRARNLTEAIMWHGGEGAASRTLFSRMTKDERAALIKFLQSL